LRITSAFACYTRASIAADRWLAFPSGATLARAFSASLSHRIPKLRRSAATSGELASFARRAHSAACSWQYFAYDDITQLSNTHGSPRDHLLHAASACTIMTIYAIARPIKGTIAPGQNPRHAVVLASQIWGFGGAAPSQQSH
jgi:hypothetical protein